MLSQLLVFTVSVGSIVVTEGVPTREQIERLVRMLQRPTREVKSLDVIYYSKVVKPNFDPNVYRQTHQQLFDHLGGGSKDELKGSELAERIEIEEFQVEYAKAKAEIGYLSKFRISMDKGRYRREEVLGGGPDLVLFKGTPRETHLEGKFIGPDTPYQKTVVYIWDMNTIDMHGSEGIPSLAFMYDHEHKLAIARLEADRIEPRIQRDPQAWLREIDAIPSFVLLEIALGEKIYTNLDGVSGMTKDFHFKPDPEKMRAAWEGGEIWIDTGIMRTKLSVRVMVEEAYGKKLDRFEVIDYDQKGSESVRYIYAFDQEDYSRCYIEESYVRGRPFLIIHRSEFGPDGFPRQIVRHIYPISRQMLPLKHRIETIKIESLVLDQRIPDEVFEFRPPDGYQVAKSSSSKIHYFKRGEKMIAVPEED